MSNSETVKAIYEAFGKGNIPFILSCLDENIEWESWTDNTAQKTGVAWLQGRHGKDEVSEFFNLRKPWESTTSTFFLFWKATIKSPRKSLLAVTIFSMKKFIFGILTPPAKLPE